MTAAHALPAMWNLMFPPSTIQGLATFTKESRKQQCHGPRGDATKLMDAEFAKAERKRRTAQAAAELAESWEKSRRSAKSCDRTGNRH